MNEQPKPNKKPFFYYAMIAMLILMLLNAFVFPSLMTPRVTEVSYDKFLDMLSGGQVTVVELQENERELYFKAADENGAERIYSTGVFPDADLQKRLSESGVTFSAVAPQENSTLMNFLFTWIFPTLFLILPMVLLWRMMQKRMGDGSNMMSFGMGKSNAKMYVAAQTGKTFADVAGQEEAKEALEEIVDFLHNPDKYRSVGAVMPKGVLLVGPPGTGKTLLARAVAGEANVAFLSISGSDFVELYVGVGASRVRDLFDQAKRVAPAIVFIDEIDAVGRQRGAGLGGGHDEREQTLNQLLVEMDGFSANEGVIVIAATNRKDILDPALLRPGRFDRQIYVGAPDWRGRVEILQVHARKKPLADNVDLPAIAKATAGFTGADLANLLNEGALLAARNGKAAITQQDLEAAMIKVIAGPEKKSRVVSHSEKMLTAVHEAGHAVCMYCLDSQDPVHLITIIPRAQAGGMTISLPQDDKSYASRNEMFETVVSFLGGRVAEALKLCDISTGASNDLQRATKLARDMVATYGMSDAIGPVSYSSSQEVFIGRDYEKTKPYSEATAGEIDVQVQSIMREAYKRCEEILTAHSERLDKIAGFLMENENMNRAQFEAVMQDEALDAPES